MVLFSWKKQDVSKAFVLPSSRKYIKRNLLSKINGHNLYISLMEKEVASEKVSFLNQDEEMENIKNISRMNI
jgi:hypothetical protein